MTYVYVSSGTRIDVRIFPFDMPSMFKFPMILLVRYCAEILMSVNEALLTPRVELQLASSDALDTELQE